MPVPAHPHMYIQTSLWEQQSYCRGQWMQKKKRKKKKKKKTQWEFSIISRENKQNHSGESREQQNTEYDASILALLIQEFSFPNTQASNEAAFRRKFVWLLF